MKNFHRQVFSTLGEVYVEKWSESGEATFLSIILTSGQKYRVLPGELTKKLSELESREIELFFKFLTPSDSTKEKIWIEILYFNLYQHRPIPLNSQMFDEVHHDDDIKKSDWEYEVDVYRGLYGGEEWQLWDRYVSSIPIDLIRETAKRFASSTAA